MNFVLIVVVVTGLALGYWLVSALISPQAPPEEAPREPDPAEGDDADFSPTRRWSDVLGIDRDAVATAITAAYRTAIAQYAAADADALAPEIRALARQRTAEIEAAYLEAMRGFQRGSGQARSRANENNRHPGESWDDDLDRWQVLVAG